MTKPKIFIKNNQEALVFVSEFLTLMERYKTHEALIKNIGVLEIEIKKKIKNNSKPESKNFLAEPVAYGKYIKIVSDFIPPSIKSTFGTYPPYVLYLRLWIFDKIKGTEGKVNAFAFPFTNCVIVSAGHDKRYVHCLLVHEFLHYASELGSAWSNWKAENKYRPWIVEGITELYTERLVMKNHLLYKKHGKYEEYVNAVRKIEAFLGEESFKKFYFNGDIGSMFLERNVRKNWI